MQAIAREKNTISRIELHHMPFISAAGNIPDGNPPSPSGRQLVPETSSGSGIPALEKISSRVSGLKSAYRSSKSAR